MKTRTLSAGKGLLASYAALSGSAIARRRSERALIAARIESDAANRAKSEFLANMSHELRTPLNAIIGFSHLIECGLSKDAAAVREYARDINGAGRHLLGVIADILDLARIEAGGDVVDLVPHEVNGLVTASHQLMRERAAAKSWSLILNCEPCLPRLTLDPLRTKQIVLHLLSNAVKFTELGGTVHLSAARNEEGGVTIAVVDDGRGMTPQELRVAMLPFGQVRGSATRAHEGTGLGLTIAKRLTEAQRARFVITSERGVGTRVEIVFGPTSVAQNQQEDQQ